jgi:hypothetical protein
MISRERERMKERETDSDKREREREREREILLTPSTITGSIGPKTNPKKRVTRVNIFITFKKNFFCFLLTSDKRNSIPPRLRERV